MADVAPVVDPYTQERDATLTGAQAARAAFATERDFRSASNRTIYGYKSGYHESALTTDTFIFLSSAQATSGGKLRLPVAHPQSYFAGSALAGAEVDGTNVEVLKSVADGFRTDTAQTILSAPHATFAGHSGSKMSLTGQAAAHDLLRESVERLVLSDRSAEPGWSPRAVATALGAITVASMAPGELARGQLATDLLKAEQAKTEWESCRNQAKARVQVAYDALDADERDYVLRHAATYLASTQQGVAYPRQMARSRPTTPLREIELDDLRPDEIAGGGYDLSLALPFTSVGLPKDVLDYGFYFTQPFRAGRRVL